MSIIIPEKKYLKKTGEVDYFNWNFAFPIKYIQLYRFKKIIQLLGNTHYPKLLEFGTGSGIFIPQLSKHCGTIYACDIHSNFDHLHEMCKQYGVSNYQLSTQSIEQTNFPDNNFDAIIAVSVLEFVPDLQKALKEIKRILKPEGVFITICPMESRLLDFFLSLYTRKKPAEEFGNARLYVAKELENYFTVIEKGHMVPLLGKHFPVYTHYKLKKD